MSADDTTTARIAAIEQRANAATPHEWKRNILDNGCEWNVDTEHHSIAMTCQLVGDAPANGQKQRTANAEFIAHARQDVPFLLDQLKAARAEVERLNKIYVSAVTGRAEMRTALMDERKKTLGITEWDTVEAVERVIAERDALKAKLATAVKLLNYHACAHENADGEMCENVTAFLDEVAKS